MPYPKQDHSISRGQRSRSSNHTNKKCHQKSDRRFILCQQQRSFEERQPSPQPNPKRQKQNASTHCKQCECLQRKLKEKEEHFKQIVAIYHNETDKLKEINESLREQLQELHAREQDARREVEDYKKALANCEDIAPKEHQQLLKRKKQFQIRISPIEKGKEPITIQRISEKILSQLQSPTFSQLLAGTPQPSRLNPNPDLIDKQNALKSQFQRLMSQCESTSNRSKKTTLRKQMASIANQLSSLCKL